MRPGLASCVLLAGCGACERTAAPLTQLEGATMGTTYSVQIVHLPPRLDKRSLHARVDDMLHLIDGKMSTYDPGSELSRFNASDSTDWCAMSSQTVAVIEASLRISRLTDGAFDVTVGPLVELWGFGAHGVRRRPTPEAISAALGRVGFQELELRASPPAVKKHIPGLRVDLSAIAKGYAVDEIARLLEAEGARDFLVEVGGELRASGHNPSGGPWRIAVERPPRAEGVPSRTLSLLDGAVATSGDYRNAFEEGGQHYTHVIDPRTGRPVSTGIASATVLASSALEADALATALMVLPPDEGLRLAEREGIALRLLIRADGDFVERTTRGFPRDVQESPR